MNYIETCSIKQRGKSPYLQWIKEDEWSKVLKTFAALCESYDKSPTEMVGQTPMVS